MVLDFGRDEYKMSEVQLAELGKRVREGDLTAVLKAWEQDIKVRLLPPFSSARLTLALIIVAHSLSRRWNSHPHAAHPGPEGQGRRRPRHGRHREDVALAAAHLRLCWSGTEYPRAVRRRKLGAWLDEARRRQEEDEGGEEEVLDDSQVSVRLGLT